MAAAKKVKINRTRLKNRSLANLYDDYDEVYNPANYTTNAEKRNEHRLIIKKINLLRVKEKEAEKGANRIINSLEKAAKKTVKPKGKGQRAKTLDDLREISALKNKITKKDAQIKRLKKTIKKLKDPEGEIAKKVEKKKEEKFLLENPDFLDI